MEKVACSWSGGKDSCYALMQTLQQGSVLTALVNMMNENGIISRSHGLPLPVLQQQATAMDIPLIAIPTSWADYEKNFIDTLLNIKSRFGVDAMVFGDIDLQAHRDWEEMVCAKAAIQARLPIWQKNRKELVYEMLHKGIEAMIVSCNTVMGEDFLGLMISEPLIPELEKIGVDVCGENGEFHTVVIDCPLFENKINLPAFHKIKHEEYWFLQWKD
ncbi:MAG: diphthine--ammonia ligase [Chitinophagaceae bacterium]|nr:diphthine--ammonia ligase [Chitinophagaceae bacterium]